MGSGQPAARVLRRWGRRAACSCASCFLRLGRLAPTSRYCRPREQVVTPGSGRASAPLAPRLSKAVPRQDRSSATHS